MRPPWAADTDDYANRLGQCQASLAYLFGIALCAMIQGMSLEGATKDYAAAQERVRLARARLYEEIIESLKRGRRQVDVVKATGLTRERIRQIARDAGIESDR